MYNALSRPETRHDRHINIPVDIYRCFVFDYDYEFARF